MLAKGGSSASGDVFLTAAGGSSGGTPTNSYLTQNTKSPLTHTTLLAMKQRGEKITCLTAYDASFSALIDAAEIDVILVGDSLGMVVQGHDSTLPVTVRPRRSGASPASAVPRTWAPMRMGAATRRPPG